MREMEFRAWDKRFERMVYASPMAIFNLDDEDHELMQYTGLKDKNGKKIYQGDVLKLAESEESLYVCEVCWNEKTAAFAAKKLEDDKPYCENLFGVEVAEVIGNIYENPELLKS